MAPSAGIVVPRSRCAAAVENGTGLAIHQVLFDVLISPVQQLASNTPVLICGVDQFGLHILEKFRRVVSVLYALRNLRYTGDYLEEVRTHYAASQFQVDLAHDAFMIVARFLCLGQEDHFDDHFDQEIRNPQRPNPFKVGQQVA